MREFSYYLQTKDVKKQFVDLNTAKATARDALDRITLATHLHKKEKPKYVLESSYEAIRELIDAILYLDGYKSYSHEASVAYLLELHIARQEAEKIDWLRVKRNRIKYYGEDVSEENAQYALELSKKIIEELFSKKPVLRPI